MKFHRCLAFSACLILVCLATIVPALAHAALVRADPAPDAILDRAPSVVYTWFSQPLSPGSHLNIFDAQFQIVDKGNTVIDTHDSTLMRVDLADLAAGRYTVNWQALTADGHTTTGSYDFIVRDTTAITMPVLIGGGVILGVAVLLLILVRRPRHTRL